MNISSIINHDSNTFNSEPPLLVPTTSPHAQTRPQNSLLNQIPATPSFYFPPLPPTQSPSSDFSLGSKRTNPSSADEPSTNTTKRMDLGYLTNVMNTSPSGVNIQHVFNFTIHLHSSRSSTSSTHKKSKSTSSSQPTINNNSFTPFSISTILDDNNNNRSNSNHLQSHNQSLDSEEVTVENEIPPTEFTNDLGKHYFKTKAYEKAKEVFTALYEKNPEDLTVLKYLGFLAMNDAKYETAGNYFYNFRRVISTKAEVKYTIIIENKEFPLSCIWSGVVSYLQGNEDKATAFFTLGIQWHKKQVFGTCKVIPPVQLGGKSNNAWMSGGIRLAKYLLKQLSQDQKQPLELLEIAVENAKVLFSKIAH